MVFIINLIMIIIGLIALIKLDAAAGKRSLSICAGMILAFLKSAQVLFYEYSEALVATICILLACSNHFIIDYYILVLFSSLILITYLTLRLSRYSSANF